MIWYNINDMLYKDWMKMYNSKIETGAEGLEMFGHTQDYHCGLSDDQIIDRIKYDNKDAGSSFYSKEDMNRCIITALKENKEKIAEWLMTKPKHKDFAIYQKNISDSPIGHGFTKDMEEIATRDAVVVLSTHGNDILTEFGFIVKTAYPDVSESAINKGNAWKTGMIYEKEQSGDIMDKLYNATIGLPKIKVDRYDDTIKYTLSPKSLNGHPLYMFCDKDQDGNISVNLKIKDDTHFRKLNTHERMVANSECKLSIDKINEIIQKIVSGEFIVSLENLKYKDEVMDIYEIDSRSGFLKECLGTISDQDIMLVHVKAGENQNGNLYIQSNKGDISSLMDSMEYTKAGAGKEKDKTYTIKEINDKKVAVVQTGLSYSEIAKRVKASVTGYTETHYRERDNSIIQKLNDKESWIHSDKYVNAFALNKKSGNFENCINHKGMESAISMVYYQEKKYTDIFLSMNKNIGYAGTDIRLFAEDYMQINNYLIKTSGLNDIIHFKTNENIDKLINDISCAVCSAEADEPDRELQSENEYVRVFDASCNDNIWHGFYSDEYGDTKALLSLMHEPNGKQFIRVQINEEDWNQNISAASLIEKFDKGIPWENSDSYPEKYSENGNMSDFCYDTGVINEDQITEYVQNFSEYIYNAIETAEQLKEKAETIIEEDIAIQREDLYSFQIPEYLHDEIIKSMSYWIAAGEENDFDLLFDRMIERFGDKIEDVTMNEELDRQEDNLYESDIEETGMVFEEECL